MKSSTVKQVKKALRTKEFYAIPSSMYVNTNSYYIEVYVNVKRTVKVSGHSEERSCERALVKEETSLKWAKLGYEIVDCDFNVVTEEDYKSFKKRSEPLRRNTNGR